MVECRRNRFVTGATLLLDGRAIVVPGFERGNFLGPTVLSDVTTTMDVYTNEIFGPVLACMCVDTLDQAIALINSNPFGNGTALFTQSVSNALVAQHSCLLRGSPMWI